MVKTVPLNNPIELIHTKTMYFVFNKMSKVGINSKTAQKSVSEAKNRTQNISCKLKIVLTRVCPVYPLYLYFSVHSSSGLRSFYFSIEIALYSGTFLTDESKNTKMSRKERGSKAGKVNLRVFCAREEGGPTPSSNGALPLCSDNTDPVWEYNITILTPCLRKPFSCQRHDRK